MPVWGKMDKSSVDHWVNRLGFNNVESLNSATAVVVVDSIPQEKLARVIYGREIKDEFPSVDYSYGKDSTGRVVIHARDNRDRGDASEALHSVTKMLFRS